MARTGLDLSSTINGMLGDPFHDPESEADLRQKCRNLVDCSRSRHVLLKFGEEAISHAINRRGVRFHFVVFRPAKDESQSRFLVLRTSYLLWLDQKFLGLRYQAEMGLESLRRSLAAAKEAAEDRRRSAIERILALTRLDVLLALLATFATEAMGLVRPIPLPRVLAAGGQTRLFTPLN